MPYRPTRYVSPAVTLGSLPDAQYPSSIDKPFRVRPAAAERAIRAPILMHHRHQGTIRPVVGHHLASRALALRAARSLVTEFLALASTQVVVVVQDAGSKRASSGTFKELPPVESIPYDVLRDISRLASRRHERY